MYHLTYHIPINLFINLKEALEEIETDLTVSVHELEWTIEHNGHVLGWILFQPYGSFFDIEIVPSVKDHELILSTFFFEVSTIMSESVGSDQCKTGKCGN